MHLSRPSVSAAVTELIATGLVAPTTNQPPIPADDLKGQAA
jgi:hypothetical protein